MRAINIECKTVNKNGEIEFGSREVDIYTSLFEYASYYKYVESPNHGPAYEDLPEKYRVFPLEYWPVNERYFHTYNPEFDIDIDGVAYSQVDCSESSIPNPENHRISYIPRNEIYKNLFALSCIARTHFGCDLLSKRMVFKTFEDAEKALPEFHVIINNDLIENYPEVEKHLEEEEKRREQKKKLWKEQIKGFYYVIMLRDFTSCMGKRKVVGIGKTEKEALFDARERLDQNRYGKAYENLAWNILGKDYLRILSEKFPGQYNPNGDAIIIIDRSVSLECIPTYISKKAYDAIKEHGYDIELFEDECIEITKADVYRLPEEIDGRK